MVINVPYSGSYFISDARDQDMADRISTLIKDQQLAFSKKLLTGHVTASAFVINMERDKVLLTHHAKLDKWLQLGGHCDGIKDPFFNAHKEAYEESGLTRIEPLSKSILDIDIHPIPEHNGVPSHSHYDIRYLFAADEREPLDITDESNDLKWVRLDQLEDYNNDHRLLIMRDKLADFIARNSISSNRQS
ncbi:MAG: NUDIX hydrolase [Lentilitoribacter sp.]